MSSRVTGAGLALIAVALLAVSLATPVVLPAPLSLFAGHPTVANHTRETQDVYVGYYSAQLCNVGGDGTCKSGDATLAFRAVGYAELALTAGLAVIALTLALLTLRRSERRKRAARLLWIVGGLALACAGALIAIGPFQGASAPVGLGMAVHGAGLLGAMIAGAIAVRPPPPIRLRVANRGAQPAALPTAQAFAARQPPAAAAAASRSPPAARAGARDPRDPRDPFGQPPDEVAPADRFAAHGERPPFSSPQLRPLYEANPAHGGTGGLLPIERPAIPSPPPGPPPPPPPRPPGAMAAPGFGSDEAHAAIAAYPGDASRPRLPFAGEPSRPMPPPPPFAVDASRPMPPMAPTSGDASRPMPPLSPMSGDESRSAPPLFSPDEPRTTPPRFSSDDPRSPPPTPGARAKPQTAPPPLPPPFATAPPPHPGQAGHKPRTQVSLVPPMPDNDLPIAPPTAQITTDLGPDAAAPRHGESTLFPRAETPLAPPPLPIAPPPGRREVPVPRALRDSQVPRPAALRAAVPMPARADRSGPSPTRPPAPPAAPGRPGAPRPTISTTVPPIPAIPTIPPIPPLKRAETDVTDPEGQADASGDPEAATASRVPIEVGDYVSQTNVSVGVPTPEEIDAAVDGAGARVPDTSPSGQPVTTARPDEPTRAAEPISPDVAAAVAASRPTIQLAAEPRPAPGGIAPALPRTLTPQVRDPSMPKLPISTAPASLPPPRDNKQAMGPSPACPQCESPMAWVEEHLRFYCKSCRMYF